MTDSYRAIGDATRIDFVPFDQLVIGSGLRSVKKNRVDFLQWDISIQGQLQSILVVERPDGFHLLDGYHRVEAMGLLGLKSADAKILPPDTSDYEAQFAALMANINREELTKLERAEYLSELDAAIKLINPAARHGGDRRSTNVAKNRVKERGGVRVAIFATRTQLAEALGLSKRLVELANEIVKGLSDETKSRVRGTWIEDHQVSLKALSELGTDLQSKICDQLLSKPPMAKSVVDALELANGGELKSHNEKLRDRFDSTWSRLPSQEQSDWVVEHFDAIAAIIRSKGLSV